MACEPEGLEGLRGEIAKLQEERVEAQAVEKARKAADGAEQELEAQTDLVDQMREREAESAATQKELERAGAAETERARALRDEVLAVQQQTVEQARLVAERQQEIDRARERARFVCDQASTLARELRPQDPDWATARRVQSVNEFVTQTAKSYPEDPVLAALATQPVGASPAEPVSIPSAGRAAALRAAEVRDRVARVFEIDLTKTGEAARAQPE
jgi:hypothetical protein